MTSNREALMTTAKKAFGEKPFLLADLIVSAHAADPARWCMRGFPEYPDSKKVAAELSRKGGREAYVRLGPNALKVA